MHKPLYILVAHITLVKARCRKDGGIYKVAYGTYMTVPSLEEKVKSRGVLSTRETHLRRYEISIKDTVHVRSPKG